MKHGSDLLSKNQMAGVRQAYLELTGLSSLPSAVPKLSREGPSGTKRRAEDIDQETLGSLPDEPLDDLEDHGAPALAPATPGEVPPAPTEEEEPQDPEEEARRRGTEAMSNLTEISMSIIAKAKGHLEVEGKLSFRPNGPRLALYFDPIPPIGRSAQFAGSGSKRLSARQAERQELNKLLSRVREEAGLEAAFLMDSYPSEEQYQRLATNLVLSVIQVREWFCNRRKWGRASPSSPASSPGGEAKATAAGAAGSPQAGTSGPRDLGGVSDAPAVFCSVAGEGQKDVDSPATGGTVICITETGKPLPAGEEASLKFLTSLRRFILLKTDGMELGIGAYRIPRMGNEEVNLPQLYRSVVMCGGYHKTIQKKGSWKVVAFHMRVPSTVTNAAYMLRVHYEKFLLEYEYTFWDNPDIEMDLLRNTRFTREQILLSPVPSGPKKRRRRGTEAMSNLTEIFTSIIAKAKGHLEVEGKLSFRPNGPRLALCFDPIPPIGRSARFAGSGAKRLSAQQAERQELNKLLSRVREEERNRRKEEIEGRKRKIEELKRQRQAEREAERALKMQLKLDAKEKRELERQRKMQEKLERERELQELKRKREEERAKARIEKQLMREELKRKREEELQERKRLRAIERMKAAEERAQAKLDQKRRKQLVPKLSQAGPSGTKRRAEDPLDSDRETWGSWSLPGEPLDDLEDRGAPAPATPDEGPPAPWGRKSRRSQRRRRGGGREVENAFFFL